MKQESLNSKNVIESFAFGVIKDDQQAEPCFQMTAKRNDYQMTAKPNDNKKVIESLACGVIKDDQQAEPCF